MRACSAAVVLRQVAPLLSLVLVVGCGHIDTAGSGNLSAQAPPDHATRVRALKDSFPAASIQLDDEGTRVAVISGLAAPAVAATPADVAASVLRQRVVADALGISPDLRELCAATARPDPQLPGRAVVRRQQCINGVKVFGAEVVMNVRMTPPTVETLTNALVAPERIPATTGPRITAAAAVAKAAAAVHAASPANGGANDPEPELVIFDPQRFQLEGASRLCWLVRTGGIAVMVDAETGAVAYQFPTTIQ